MGLDLDDNRLSMSVQSKAHTYTELKLRLLHSGGHARHKEVPCNPTIELFWIRFLYHLVTIFCKDMG